MADTTRRDFITTSAAVAAAAAAGRALGQRAPQAAMPPATFYEKGAVRIRYLDTGGPGFPLLIIPGGGLNSTISGLISSHPFNAIDEFKSEFRCVTCDLRTAYAGESTGPLESDRPWDAFTDDHLGIMDHLGIDKFMVLGFCIGGPFIWNLLERAPDRVVAAVAAQPSGFRPEQPTLFYDNNTMTWGPEIMKRRPEITAEMVDRFLTRMYKTNADFVFTVTRDFVRHAKRPCSCCPTTSRRIPTPSRWRP